MDITANGKKSFTNYLATGEYKPSVVTISVAKTDPIRRLLAHMLAVGMLAKDLHYSAEGKAFYSLHQLADLVWSVRKLTDDLIEVYYLGECAKDAPGMSELYRDACDLADLTGCKGGTKCEMDIECLKVRCRAGAGCVEECKSIAPLSGTGAILDEISKMFLQSYGLLERTSRTSASECGK